MYWFRLIVKKVLGKISFPLDKPGILISHILDEILKGRISCTYNFTFKNGTKNENAENIAVFDFHNQSADSV